ncbi:hypothetical protein OH77DRAFT_203099 [Trametes cingulata]|nr:hypothetical protein OH77DRAFT_203099 [Trametes cingulata]
MNLYWAIGPNIPIGMSTALHDLSLRSLRQVARAHIYPSLLPFLLVDPPLRGRRAAWRRRCRACLRRFRRRPLLCAPALLPRVSSHLVSPRLALLAPRSPRRALCARCLPYGASVSPALHAPPRRLHFASCAARTLPARRLLRRDVCLADRANH